MSDVGVEAAAVIAGSFLSGAIMSVYMLTIPALFESTSNPGQLVKHWTRIYLNGHYKGPVICLSTTALYGLATVSKYAAGENWKVFATAGALTTGMIPFTVALIVPTNNTLFRLEGQAKKDTGGSAGASGVTWAEAEGLVRKWNRLNAIRSLFPLSGAVLGLMAILKVVSF
ncbi:hypothetical protein BJY04DRAFT_199292 [Aspergillus karnatakaensis]|uniref:DUF1772 domain-containing protein n=1 Tax=Aspergillus karnatakaensis TaxID=1810916 RepID=UPI003CCE2154